MPDERMRLDCRGIDQLAPDVHQLRGRPRNAVNVYLLGDVLIDSGTNLSGKGILRQLAGRSLSAHALTHAHPDHFGSSHAVCERLRIPLWCGERDVGVAEGSSKQPGRGLVGKLLTSMPPPDPHPVERRLREGDEVAGFEVLETPGHSPGHISLWRESDRTLVCGDVFFNMNLLTLRPGLREPPRALTPNPARNRESARRLATLRPALVLFGHGPPLRDAERLVRFADSLAG
jgi:glyoxylase-like metal-dependent hydrolase (beta-lactamase superfamily II)